MSKEDQALSKTTYFLSEPENKALQSLRRVKARLGKLKRVSIKISDSPATFIEKIVNKEGNIKIGDLVVKSDEVNLRLEEIKKEIQRKKNAFFANSVK